MLLAIHFVENFLHRAAFAKCSTAEFRFVGRIELNTDSSGATPNYGRKRSALLDFLCSLSHSDFMSDAFYEFHATRRFSAAARIKNPAAEKQSNRRARFSPCAPIMTHVQARSLRSAPCPGSRSRLARCAVHFRVPLNEGAIVAHRVRAPGKPGGIGSNPVDCTDEDSSGG